MSLHESDPVKIQIVQGGKVLVTEQLDLRSLKFLGPILGKEKYVHLLVALQIASANPLIQRVGIDQALEDTPVLDRAINGGDLETPITPRPPTGPGSQGDPSKMQTAAVKSINSEESVSEPGITQEPIVSPGGMHSEECLGTPRFWNERDPVPTDPADDALSEAEERKLLGY